MLCLLYIAALECTRGLVLALRQTSVCRFGPNPDNPNQVLMADPDNEPKSPFPVPPSAQEIQQQLPGGSIIDACSFAEDAEEVLRVVNSKRLVKNIKKLQDSRKAAKHQSKKGQKSASRK